MVLCPSILHELALIAFEETLEKRESLQISTSDVVKMAKYVLQNNYFEFTGENKQQPLWYCHRHWVCTSISMYMDQCEWEILKIQIHQTLVWFRYVDEIFFMWTHGQDKWDQFVDFNKFHPSLKFTHGSSIKSHIFDVNI